MPTPFVNFAGLSGAGEVDEPAQALDQNFQNVASIVQCTATGTANAIILTANSNQPAIPAPPNSLQQLGFLAVANSTGLMTITVGPNTYNLYQNNGTTQCGSGDVLNGKFYVVAYNPALNLGAGGFSMSGGSGLAPIASPAFTGTPTCPTAGAVNNTTIANTATVYDILMAGWFTLGSHAILYDTGSLGSPQWSGPAPAVSGTSTSSSGGTWRNLGTTGVFTPGACNPPYSGYLAQRIA